MSGAPWGQVSVKTARDYNDLVTLSFMPRDALHCLRAQDIWQIGPSEVSAG